MLRRNVALFSAAVFFSLIGTLHAQQVDKDADADRLFKEGQKLMEERKFADACPKLESAYRKDQQLGTLLNVAYCHKEMGSTWIAWTEFREAETKAIELKRNDRRDFARERMKELEKNLSRLIIDPSSKVDIYEVDLEDRRIFDAEKGIAFAAEPGQRKLTFRAKGKKPATSLVNVGTVKESKSAIQHVPTPDMQDEDPVPVAPEPTTTQPTQPTQPASDANQSTWSTQKTLAVVAGGAGVVGIAIGSIFGISSLGTDGCNDGPPPKGGKCTSEIHDSDASKHTFSTVGFIAGGVLFAGGVVLWLTAPSGAQHGAKTQGPTVSADLGPTWAGLHGTF